MTHVLRAYRAGMISGGLSAAVIMAAFSSVTAPAHAQSQQTADNAAALAEHAGEISNLINNVDDLESSRILREFKTITAGLGDIAPFLGVFSVILNFAQMGEQSDLDVIRKEFEKTNAKIDGLSVQLEAAVQKINMGTDINNQKESLRSERIMLMSAKDNMNSYLKMSAGDSDSSKVLEKKLTDFNLAAKSSSERCAGDFLEQSAIFYNGNLQKIADVGFYLLKNIQIARDVDSEYYIVQSVIKNPDNRSADAIQSKAVEFMKDYDTYATTCATALSKVLAKYKNPEQQMKSAVDYIEPMLSDGRKPETAQEIVDELGRQYPYLNWIVVKYDGVRRFENHLARSGYRMHLFVPTAERSSNILITYYEKGSTFNDQGFRLDQCQYALNRLANGLITTDTPSRSGTNSGWPSGDLREVIADQFEKWCESPLVDMWFSRNYGRHPEIAATDPGAMTDNTYPAHNSSSSPAAFYHFSNYGNYLITLDPQPAGSRTIDLPLQLLKFRNVYRGTEMDARPVLNPNKNWGRPSYTYFYPFPVAGTRYYRLRSYYTSDDTFLNVENGTLVAGPIQPKWYSAMWRFEQVAGAPEGQYRICERWKGTCLHLENGKLEAGKAPRGWLSARWTLVQ